MTQTRTTHVGVATDVALRPRESVQGQFLLLAATGTELDLATSLSRLTGATVVLRDGFGHESARVTPAGEPVTGNAGRPLTAVIGGRAQLGTVELDLPTDLEHARESAQLALRQASVALGVLRAHAAAMTEMENRLSRDLVVDLVDGIPATVAIDRAAAQGYDLRGRHEMVVSTWSSDPGSGAADRQVDRIRSAVASQRLPCLATRRQDMVVLLARHGVDIGRLYADLCRAHGGLDGVVAKGEPIHSPTEVPRAFQQARTALTARRQCRDPRGCVAYADLGIERILALEGNADEVDRLVDDWLGDLLRYDDDHGTDLVPTLAQHLDLGGRYDATAHALTIHRNTLRYRLSRITVISGHDLRDVDTRLNLHLALRAWRLRRPGAW